MLNFGWASFFLRFIRKKILSVLLAERVQALLHLGAQVVLNPGVGGFQPLRFEDAAYLGFHAGGIAGEAQEVIAGELNK